MGQYEPNDSRAVTHSTATAPGEPERTGPREAEARQQAQQQSQSDKSDKKEDTPGKGDAHVAYGNSTDRKGQMEQDIATDGARNGTKGDDSVVGETAADPAARAKADGNRPISGN